MQQVKVHCDTGMRTQTQGESLFMILGPNDVGQKGVFIPQQRCLHSGYVSLSSLLRQSMSFVSKPLVMVW